MKVSQRRNRLVLAYALLLLFFLALGRIATAAENHESIQAPPPDAIPGGGHQNAEKPDPGGPREPGAEDFERLGRMCWKAAHPHPAASASVPKLSEEDLQNIVRYMEQNQRKMQITLDELFAFLRSPAICSRQIPRGDAWGMSAEEALQVLNRALGVK